MKFVKFLTRKYTPLEHSLIMESLLKKNTSISGIYYTVTLDISKKGLIDIYVSEKDVERNRKWVYNQFKKDKYFIKKMLKKGFLAVEKLSKLPCSSLLNKIPKLSSNKVIQELFRLRKKLFDFGGYFDFTFYVEDLGINLLDNKIVKKFSKFHDYRKMVFLKYFEFFKKVIKKIAERNKIRSGNLDYLLFSEIVCFLRGNLTAEKIDEMQKERKRRYIIKRFNNKEKIITSNFNQEIKRIKKNFLKENIVDTKKIIGIPVQGGTAHGRVKIITQLTSFKNIPSNKIIVTQMTNPSMVPILKKSLAIVTDEGGLLCHAALISREFGIPCVVGTKIATKVLKDGDLVEVDAYQGIIKKLEN